MNVMHKTMLANDAIHVWRFPLIAARQEITSLRHWLSSEERSIAERISSSTERDKRIVAWGRLRFILSRYLACGPQDIEIARTRFGRPEIALPIQPGIQFNLSHSGSLGLVAISFHAVGIDIEKVNGTRDVSRLARRFFTAREADQLQAASGDDRIAMFYRLWVLKEAYLKAHGARVPSGLAQCDIIVGDDSVRLCESIGETGVFNGILIEIPVSGGYCAALAALQTRADIDVFDL